MKLMIARTALVCLATVFMIISTSNISASANTITTTHQTPQNNGLTVSIANKTLQVATPMNPSSTPVTVKVISNDGSVVFEKTTTNSSMVIGDGIDHMRVVGDGIDHMRVVGDGIDHMRVQVSQAGQVIFDKKL